MFCDSFFKANIEKDKVKGSNKAASFNLLTDPEIIEYGFKNYPETFETLRFFESLELHKILNHLFGQSLFDIYQKGTRYKKLSKDYCSMINIGNNGSHNLKNKSDSDSDLSLYTSIKYGINTPSLGSTSSVRDIHIDHPTKLYSLLYFRDNNDDFAGGDLLLYRFKKNKIRLFNNVYASHKDCIVSKVIPYRRNTLILFINSLKSIHGVVERSNVPLERRY